MNSSCNALATKILIRQFNSLFQKAPEGVIPILNEDDPLDIQSDIMGPISTPYEGGLFRVKFFFPVDFPQSPPKGMFLTKIYHPNISEKGDICVNTLKKDWNPKLWSLYNLFEVVKCLLIVPFPQSALNEEAGKLFMDNYEEYYKIAKIYTNVYANKKNKDNLSSPKSEKPKLKIKCVNYISNNKSLQQNNEDKKMNLGNIGSLNNSFKPPQQENPQDEIKKWLNRI